jgi:uncharacterized iron-regulated membrane protein
VLAWGTLLLVLFIGNWITDDRGVNPAVAGFASVLIYAVALMLWLARREALRRGAPAPRAEPEAVPEASAGAVLAGLSVACILFGMVWATFLVYFGIGTLLLALGRIGVELRVQRTTVPRARRDEDPG